MTGEDSPGMRWKQIVQNRGRCDSYESHRPLKFFPKKRGAES